MCYFSSSSQCFFFQSVGEVCPPVAVTVTRASVVCWLTPETCPDNVIRKAHTVSHHGSALRHMLLSLAPGQERGARTAIEGEGDGSRLTFFSRGARGAGLLLRPGEFPSFCDIFFFEAPPYSSHHHARRAAVRVCKKKQDKTKKALN